MEKKSGKTHVQKKLRGFLICVLLLTCCVTALTVYAQKDSTQVIRVGMFPYEEQMSVDQNSNYSGYGYDYLQEIAHRTGWRYEIVDASWDDCLNMLERGEIDLMGVVTRTPARDERFDFSMRPMLSTHGVLLTSLDNETLPYEDFASFEKLKIGTLKGSFQNENFLEYSRTHGFTPQLHEYDTQPELDAALESGELDAIIMTSLLRSQKLRIVAAFGENDAYFATTKGNTSILNQLDDAMHQILLDDPFYTLKLNQKYYDVQTVTAISFTKEELEFIKKCPPVSCVYIPDAVPISYRDKSTGDVQGVAVDICDMLEQRTGLKFQWLHPKTASEAAALLSHGEALLLPAKYADYNWAQQNDVTLTDPYLWGQMVMVTGGQNPSSDIVALYDQDSQSRLVANVVSKDAQLKQYDTIIDCMDAVLRGEANATFVNSTIASYLINNPKYAQLQTTPLLGFSADVAMAVSGEADPLLLSVLNKGLRNISSTEINQSVLWQMKREQAGPIISFLYSSPVESIILVCGIFLLLFLVLFTLLYLLLKSAKSMTKTLYIDALTGHPNYQALSKEATNLIEKKPGGYALIYLDIHHFKAINDTFGYETGDRVLIATAAVLKEFIASDERVARIYADTFVLLLRYASKSSFEHRLDSLSQKLRNFFFEGKDNINPLFCGGVYPLPHNFDDLDKACDRANYAKDSISQYFSNTFAFYDDVMRNRVLAEKELEGSMHSALAKGEFVPYYQPKLNTITEKVVGAEALVRWIHPEKGLISPAEFLPFYEKNGFVVNIDLSIFEQVCRDMHDWLERGNEGMPVSVNFSRLHMRNPNLPQQLKGIADRYQIPTNFLEVEVTETEELENVEIAVDFVLALKAYGFRVSIDDYGTGYSSISFLQQLPLDSLKLDRKFILNAMKTDRARDVMRYLVAAMQKNEIRVVCEGVETKAQRDFIVSLDCRFIQGFFYSMPLPLVEFEDYLGKWGIEDSESLNFIPITNFELNRWSGAEDFLTKAIPSWIISCFTTEGHPIHYISPSFLEDMGYSALELKTFTNGFYTNLIHQEDLPHVLEQLMLYKDSAKTLSLRYRIRKKNGDYLWLQEVNKRILIDDGHEAVLGVCTDITNIVNLQNEKSRLIDTIPGGVGELLLTDNGPIIQQATEFFYEILGHTKEEMAALGNNLLHIIYEQDLPEAEESVNLLIEQSLTSCEYIFRIWHQDKSLHWISLRGTISFSQPNLQATVIVYNNDQEMQEKLSAEVASTKLELALALTEQVVFEYDIQTEKIHSMSGFPMCGLPKGKAVNIKRELIENHFIHPDDACKLLEVHKKVAAGETRISHELRVRSKLSDPNSSFIWLHVTLSTIFDDDGIPVRAVGVVEDIDRRKHFEYAFLQEAQYRKAFTESSLMAYEINLSKNIIQRITGSRGFRLEEMFVHLENPNRYSEALPAAATALVAPDDYELFINELSLHNLSQLYRKGIFEKELEYRRQTLDGKELWTSVLLYLFLEQLTGDVMGYAYHRDIHARKEAERGLMDQAARDPLTNLFNRTTAEQMVQSFLLHSTDPHRVQAFLMLDLDHFKEINDTYGHLTGDKCLMKLASLITEQVREKDIVARMGGDEFAILLKDLPNEDKAIQIAEKLALVVEQIGIELNLGLKTGVSIGLAISPRHGTNFEQLYLHADKAMYKAKRAVGEHIVMVSKGTGADD